MFINASDAEDTQIHQICKKAAQFANSISSPEEITAVLGKFDAYSRMKSAPASQIIMRQLDYFTIAANIFHVLYKMKGGIYETRHERNILERFSSEPVQSSDAFFYTRKISMA